MKNIKKIKSKLTRKSISHEQDSLNEIQSLFHSIGSDVEKMRDKLNSAIEIKHNSFLI